MNKLFLYLLVIGLVILVVVASWEVFQVTSGAKSTGDFVVVEIPNTVLVPPLLEDHLEADPGYIEFLSSESLNQ